ncbi:MAG: glycosyltransferase family 4 protein [Acidimicrobiales bacterium]|nr:glycosyltransferase family 4 protein [Acidimicrobiales bacterium]HRW36493.1 glycosyltransferase family 4 protein [Aquihabitans sp.]
MTRPRLLFLGHGAERTGPPILLGHLLDGLHRLDRHDLSVVTARSGPLLAAYERASAQVAAVGTERQPLRRTSALLRQVGASSAIEPAQDLIRRRALRRVPRADLVYVNAATPPTADLLRVLDPEPSVPVLVHVHELDIGLRLNLGAAQRAALFERADHLIAASRPVAALLRDGHGIAADRITTCAEFVDADAVRPDPRATVRAELGIPDDAAVVGSVGLPDWRKDPDHLLRAASLLERSGAARAPWVVWIGGDPASDDGRRLADEARRLGLTDRFRHVGHLDRPDRLLHALDVFALPAREDALPLAALEAAAAGLPIVCFRAGGVADLCDRGAGTTVAYPDTVAFADALARLLDDGAERERTGARARELVAAEHDVAPGVDRIVAVIDRFLPQGVR